MKALLIGGTGLISVGIVKHLLARGAAVTLLNRGQRGPAPADLETLTADRNEIAAMNAAIGGQTFDVVIDMVCFHPDQAKKVIAQFAGKCRQFIFCSTVCTYGIKVPAGVFVDETFPQEPISGYGRDKLACERLFLEAHARGDFAATIIRPSSTYGPGGNLIDQVEFNPVAWDRIEKGKPVLIGGDGLGLWVSTHRDDCGKAFAYAALNEKTFGQSYNATRDVHQTWLSIYRVVGSVLGKPVNAVFMPASWIVAHDPSRFGLLREITQFHGAYSSEKAKRDIPQYVCDIDFATGASQTLDAIRARGAWKNSDGDTLYDSMISKALAAGVTQVTLT